MTLAARLEQVRERIDCAVARRGPGPDVTLVGVSKRHPAQSIARAAECGLGDFAENYAQELRDKRAELPDLAVRWHFIGPLQRNKVKYVDGVSLMHSVDRVRILDALEARGHSRGGEPLSVLLQVNIAGEAGKAGLAAPDVADVLARFADLDHVRCRGLMLIPPAASPEATRPHFRALRTLRDELAQSTRPGVDLSALSMGMSADFEVAIGEGATLVRVGTAIFGPRPDRAARQ